MSVSRLDRFLTNVRMANTIATANEIHTRMVYVTSTIRGCVFVVGGAVVVIFIVDVVEGAQSERICNPGLPKLSIILQSRSAFPRKMSSLSRGQSFF